jgi:hypothetical protein
MSSQSPIQNSKVRSSGKGIGVTWISLMSRSAKQHSISHEKFKKSVRKGWDYRQSSGFAESEHKRIQSGVPLH